MRYSKVILSSLLAVGLSLPTLSTAHARVRLNYTKTTLTRGHTRRLKISGTRKKVRWSSSDKKVATVSAHGLVRAKKKGSVKIRAKVGKAVYTCRLKVDNPTPYISSVYSQVNVGASRNFHLVYSPGKVSWSVSDTSLASIDQNGKMSAVKTGHLYVYATVQQKRYKRSVSIEKPSFASTTNTVYVGQKKKLATKNLYNHASYSSSDTKIAKISDQGIVTGKSAGSAVMTMKVGGEEYTTTVNVPVMKISKTKLSIAADTTYDLDIKNCLATAKWSSNNTKVAAVSKGGLIDARSAGTATISANVNGTILNCQLTVKPSVATVNATSSKKPKKSYNHKRTTNKKGIVGQTISAKAVLGSGSFKSSNRRVALVTRNGLVMPMSAGKVTITNTSRKKKMTISITDPGDVREGVDVSYHNGSIDFKKLKKAGVDFAIIRGGNTQRKLRTTNSDGIDLNLKKNIGKAQAAHMDYGIYWYMNASDNSGLMTTKEAAAQAATLAGYLKSYQTSYFKLPIYLDLEQTSALIKGKTNAARTSYLQSLCKTFENTLNTYGYKNVGIYSSTSWYKNYLRSDYFVNRMSSRWLAHYGYNSVTGTALANYTSIPTFKYKGVIYYPDLWQTGEFPIEGSHDNLDMDYRYL